MLTAIENFVAVGIVTSVTFFISIVIIIFIKRLSTSSNLRIVRRKPLLVPAIIFLLVIFVSPGERIGPPPELPHNSITGDYIISFVRDFQVYELEPYLGRVTVTYFYGIDLDEIISCNVIVSQTDSVVANVTTNILKHESAETESAHSTFDLPYGNYTLRFTQVVLDLYGNPTTRRRNVHVLFEQLQDLQWIDEALLWDQYRLVLILTGMALLVFGIYLTDHKEDNEVERERYERKRRGERNYPYWRADRRKVKERQWAERMRDKR